MDRGPLSWDAIVVAGCRVLPDGAPSPALDRRVRHAAALWHAGLAPQLVLTGGPSDAGTEAACAARLARALGVPDGALVLEEESRNTRENAQFAAALLGRDRRVLVVSCDWHVWRCTVLFRREFAAAAGSGARAPLRSQLRGGLRELPALLALTWR